jgi:RNA-directed DNA polymerase
VLKAISLVLTEQLTSKLSPHCYHLAGKGLKACVRQIKKEASHYHYVCRSDVNSYYATINHDILMAQLRELIQDTALLELIEQLLTRLDDVNGEFYSVTTGINKGSPLSPLLGAVYLLEMDKVLGEYCAKYDLKYYRYMDDWIILCKTRHQLRTAAKLMNQSLNDVKQTKHPFKTYIGKIKKTGFDFLGYRIGQKKEKLTLAWKTWSNHLTKLQQLYEQDVPKTRIAEYVTRWLTWVRSGVAINLKEVIQEGLNSELAKRIGDVGWLRQVYGRVVEQWVERS